MNLLSRWKEQLSFSSKGRNSVDTLQSEGTVKLIFKGKAQLSYTAKSKKIVVSLHSEGTV